jgi:hypothetical protein
VIEGDVAVNGERMETGDAAQVTDEPMMSLDAADTTELIIVDVSLVD